MKFKINLSKVALFWTLLAFIPILTSVHSQSGNTLISVAVPQWMQDIWGSALFDDFEASHPGIEIAMVDAIGFDGYLPAFDINSYLERSTEVASSADVVYVSSFTVYPESTRSGYFYDLRPLIDSDTSMDIGDFYPSLVEAFQWDNGIWALPIGGNLWVLSYDPSAFDAANISYPNAQWNIDEFLLAVEALYQEHLQSNEQLPGFFIATLNEWAFLLRTLSNTSFYDNSSYPEPISIAHQELANILDILSALEEQGAIQQYDPTSNYSDLVYRTAPMRIGPLTNHTIDPVTTSAPVATSRTDAATLPGGRVGVEAYGFAISSGTANPQLAYEVLKYLSTDPQITRVHVYDVPAHRLSGDASTVNAAYEVPRNLTPDIVTLMENALESGLPTSELRYADYVLSAYFNSYGEGIDPLNALETAQLTAIGNLQYADLSREQLNLSVVTPTLFPEVATNEIILNFAIQAPIMPLPNISSWEQFFMDFSAEDPQVGFVNFQSSLLLNYDAYNEYDCFYSTTNLISFFGPSNLLDVSPLLNSDPNFTIDDLLPQTLFPYRLDNKLLGIPIAIFPSAIWYNVQELLAVDSEPSQNIWTIDKFEDLINNVEIQPLLELRSSSISDILLLIAAYGGLPFDYRTNPPILDITGRETIAAIQRVSLLIRDGTISHRLFDSFLGNNESEPLAFTDILDSSSYQLARLSATTEVGEIYGLTSFPVGSQYIPLSFSTGAGYISSTTLYPEACYRLLSNLSNEVTLYMAMPTRISVLDRLEIELALPEELLDFYHNFAQSLQNPAAVIIPRVSSPELTWFQEAIANYMAEDTSLEEELVVVEEKITELRQCVENASPEVTNLSGVTALCAESINQAQ